MHCLGTNCWKNGIFVFGSFGITSLECRHNVSRFIIKHNLIFVNRRDLKKKHFALSVFSWTYEIHKFHIYHHRHILFWLLKSLHYCDRNIHSRINSISRPRFVPYISHILSFNSQSITKWHSWARDIHRYIYIYIPQATKTITKNSCFVFLSKVNHTHIADDVARYIYNDFRDRDSVSYLGRSTQIIALLSQTNW